MNYLIVSSLAKYFDYYGESLKVAYPSATGEELDLKQVSKKLSERLIKIFAKDDNGYRAVYGGNLKMQKDPYFKDHILFYEYFHGDNGRGVGASHQTGWTGLVAELIDKVIWKN